MSLQHCSGVFLAKVIAGGIEIGTKWDLGYSGNIILSVIMCYSVFNIHEVFLTFPVLFFF